MSFENITLYGVEHSPWVQGIWLALHHHKVKTRLTSFPLGWNWVWQKGLVFPTLKLSDGSMHIDSFNMYVLLEEAGFELGVSQMSEDERIKAQVELEAEQLPTA